MDSCFSYSSRLLVLKSCNIVERLVCVLCVQPSFGPVLDVAAREYLYIAKRRCPLRDFHWLSFAVSSRFWKGLQREAQMSQKGFGAKGRQEDACKSVLRKCCISCTKKSHQVETTNEVDRGLRELDSKPSAM